MTDDENANIRTVSVSVPDWLKHCFGDVYDTDAPDYKKLAAVMKDNHSLSMAVADLSDERLDCAATVYCDDWYYLEPEQQQEQRENLRCWCQRCHLNYDKAHHAETRRRNRLAQTDQDDFFCATGA